MNQHQALWSDAYDNSKSMGGSDAFVQRWEEEAEKFRARLAIEERVRLDMSYGPGSREQYDFYLPHTEARGLVVFIHGGYWMRMHRHYFSHLAAGACDRGWAVAIPSYDLCPDITIAGITQQIASAITHASEQAEVQSKAVRLVGHSAGGHLVTRMVAGTLKINPDSTTTKVDQSTKISTTCDTTHCYPLDSQIRRRIEHVLSISGIHDLRPLLATQMNETLSMNLQAAAAESPSLLVPQAGLHLTCWVGNDELPELKRQSALLANIWKGFDTVTTAIAEPAKHHFDVVEGLTNKSSPLVDCLLKAVNR